MADATAFWSAIRTRIQEQRCGLDEALWLLAERQHGVVAMWQLLELGFARHGVQRRVRARRLHVVHLGVYAVGHRRLPRRGRWMAAVLATGRPAILSHRSGAHHTGLLPASPRRSEVTVPGAARSHRDVLKHGNRLCPDEVMIHAGIPVTTPVRTALDLASVLDPVALEQVLARGERQGSLRPAMIARILEKRRGYPGAARLRAVHERGCASLGVAESELETSFLRFLDAHRLRRPELDGYAYHRGRAGHDGDRARDRRLVAAGWRVLRVTWRDLSAHRRELAGELRAVLGGDGARASARGC